MSEKKKKRSASFPGKGREFKRELIGKQKGEKKRVFHKSTPKKKQMRHKSGKIGVKRNPENELVGVYKQMQGGFGFVDTIDEKSGEKKGYFTHESKKLDAFEGDEVAFEVQYFKGREEAQITKVLKRSEHLIVGRLKIGKSFAFVVSDNPKIKSDIFIPGKHIGGYTDGSEVAVQILKWEGKNPEGRIVESLGNLPKGREDIYKIAFEMGARKSFPEKVMSDTKALKNYISDSDLKYRKDCRDVLTYTIDGAESKDLDDAISLEKTSSGWILYVHIADVSHYVTENTALDREARKRGTSIYLADQVIPMLPKEISNGLCSLHPGEDKLTLTCEMHIDSAGRVIKSEVYNSVIISDYRLTYKEVDALTLTLSQGEREQAAENSKMQPLSPIGREDSGVRASEGSLKKGDSLQFGGKLTSELQNNISELKTLTDVLSKNTENRGSLDFDFPETKVILDDAGNPVEYKKYERYDSYKIIEECMVLANESVSKLFAKHPFLYRIHEDPDGEDVEKFVKMLETIISPSQFSPQGRDEAAASFSPREKEFKIEGMSFSELLEFLKSSPELQYLQRLLLRSLSKARYSEKNLGHFGLALKFYSHFTSPIRRYPDLQIHRIIKEILRGKFGAERKDHYNEILPKVARRSSETADRAEKMEYKVRDMLACKYMKDKIGETFLGNISGMIEKGFFVELPNTIEGYVDFGLTGLYFESDSMSIQSFDETKKLHFGSEVEARLVDIDTSRMRLEFELV